MCYTLHHQVSFWSFCDVCQYTAFFFFFWGAGGWVLFEVESKSCIVYEPFLRSKSIDFPLYKVLVPTLYFDVEHYMCRSFVQFH